MTVRRFAKSRKLEVTTIELVALSALTLTPDSKIVERRGPGLAAGGSAGPAGRCAGDDLVERLGELDGVRVLERQDVDLSLARVAGRRAA